MEESLFGGTSSGMSLPNRTDSRCGRFEIEFAEETAAVDGKRAEAAERLAVPAGAVTFVAGELEPGIPAAPS